MNTLAKVRPDFPYLVSSLPGPKAQAIIDRDRAVLSQHILPNGSPLRLRPLRV